MARTDQQLARLRKRFEAVPASVKDALGGALDKSAAELVELARRLAPVDSGDLVDSIHFERGEHALARKIVAGDHDAFYARWVEFGTVDQPAQAFLFPAYRLLREKIQRRTVSASGRAIKKAWGR